MMQFRVSDEYVSTTFLFCTGCLLIVVICSLLSFRCLGNFYELNARLDVLSPCEKGMSNDYVARLDVLSPCEKDGIK